MQAQSSKHWNWRRWNWKRIRRVAAISFVVFSVGFALYIKSLFNQLETLFNQQNEFIPTQIYSDVVKLTAPQPRAYVEQALKRLSYTPQTEAESLTFTLHSINYPHYLVPDDHPTLSWGGQPVKLIFDSPDSGDQNALLQSIEVDGQEVPEVYLEPELVATLSRGVQDSPADKQIRTIVKFQDFPAPVWQAIISIEDQHFLDHKGFDPRGLLRAVFVNLKTLSLAQGGSTLTQQLVKNLMARHTKNVFRKINELFLAIILETRFDKEKILERYLNEVYLGQIGTFEIHGVAEGAKYFFGKRIEDLNLGEIAMMAGLIRGPAYYSPYRHWERAKGRQELVLKKMAETGQIAEEEAAEAAKLPVRLAPPPSGGNRAPYFTDFVKAELIRFTKDKLSEEEVSDAGFRVYTTLDTYLNGAAQKAVEEGVERVQKTIATDPNPAKKLVIEGALASVEQKTGYVRALIGGSNYTRSNFNRILNMKRQVGSTFKPVVYLAAFDKGRDADGKRYGPGYPMEDAPWKLTFDRGKQTWEPRNYEKEYLGWIPLRTALAHSVNTVTARLAAEVGIDRVVETAKKLGIQSELPAVPSLALGVNELSPVELVKLYTTIANRGMQDELTVIRGITNEDGSEYARFVYAPQPVYDPALCDLVTEMLQEVFTEGTARRAREMGFDRQAAGKTGTTSNYRDSWFAGFNPQLTTVVWVGLDQGSGVDEKGKARLKLTGASAALPIWITYMKRATELSPPATFPVSDLLTGVKIDKRSGHLATSSCSEAQVSVEKYPTDRSPTQETCMSTWPESVRETKLD
ncbi:MAG: transglycosylase domain-containing protein [Bacteriovoracia bacterium]